MGSGCLGPQSTLSHHNGHGQRFLRQRTGDQTVWLYGPDGYSVLSETRQFLVGAMPTQSRSEHIWLPTASGPMPLVVVMDGQPLAVHADHLNTPRRLTDAAGRVRWQWAYSAFGETPPQALAHAGQPLLDAYSLRYHGQVDDGNGLFYNFNRFYDARPGRYTQADPIGLEGGWNRFAYAEGNPLNFIDPLGLYTIYGHEIYDPNNDHYEYRFSLDFSPGHGMEELRDIFETASRFGRKSKRIPPRGAGHRDIEDSKEKNFCANQDPALREIFEQNGYKPGSLGSGSYLTEIQLREVLKKFDASLPQRARDSYPSHNRLIEKAKERTPRHPRRVVR